MRRINHRQENIDRFCERLPFLSHFERTLHRCDEPEDVGSGAHSELVDSLVGRVQKLAQRLLLGAAVLFRKYLRRKTLVRFRESDVIELNLTESHLYRLLPNPENQF